MEHRGGWGNNGGASLWLAKRGFWLLGGFGSWLVWLVGVAW